MHEQANSSGSFQSYQAGNLHMMGETRIYERSRNLGCVEVETNEYSATVD